MKSVRVTLSMVEDVKRFVNIVSKYPYDTRLVRGDYKIDAKSLLGVFSLDLSKPVTLEIASDDCAELLTEILPFATK